MAETDRLYPYRALIALCAARLASAQRQPQRAVELPRRSSSVF